MVQEVTLPEISENVESGEVIRVLVSESQTIEQEQPVVELETEKAAFELTELAERVRTKKIKPDELEGASFTVSSLGGIGGTGFTPIVYYLQVAILGVARARREIYLQQEGIPSERRMLPLSLSYDHRVVDGADGARFLRWIADALENPLLLLMEGGL